MFSPGDFRTPEGTIMAIRAQIQTACLGLENAVTTLQTDTGVKDKIAQFWIDQLIPKAKAAQHIWMIDHETRDPRLSDKKIKNQARLDVIAEIKASIQGELTEWIVTQPADRYNALEEDNPERNDLRAGDHYNILLKTRGINPHIDTPFEILHTFYLGNDKYLWHDTNKEWTKTMDTLFAIRLDSASVDGLSIPKPRAHYLLQYKNSLIGKHFKALQQLGVFHVQGMCSNLMFELWKVTGELGALLGFHEIRDMKSHLADVQILVDNLLDIWACIDPNRILVKQKLHVISHIPGNIARFGPTNLYATEVQECFNAVFRRSSIFSNHQAPSRDIATTFCDMERFKHQVSGGWWKGKDGEYIQCGVKVRSFLRNTPELQRRLGWADKSKITSGFVKRLSSVKNRQPASWTQQLMSLKHGLLAGMQPPGSTWDRCKFLVSKAQDICKEGSWVFFINSLADNKTLSGQIHSILAPTGSAVTSTNTWVILEVFIISDVKDKRLNMPVLIRSTWSCVAKPSDILFIFNAQHDCVPSNCGIVAKLANVCQERIETQVSKDTFVHKNDDRYILNLHALHNADLVREALPRSLVAPVPYFDDRYSKHCDLAAQLRNSNPAKRAAAKAKGQETKRRNKEAKKAKELQGELISEPALDLVEEDLEYIS